MSMEKKIITTYFLLACFLISNVCATDYVDCGSQGTILQLTVTGCEETPCVVYRNNNYSIGIDFIPAENSETLDTSIIAKVDGFPVHWPAPDACGLLGGKSCPVEASQTYNFWMTMAVLPEYPEIYVIVDVALIGDGDLTHACVEFPLYVR